MSQARCKLAALAALGFGACAPGDAKVNPESQPGARVTVSTSFELRDVVQPAIRELEARIADDHAEPTEVANQERILGLLSLLGGHDGRMRAMAREEARTLGRSCDVQLAAIIQDAQLEQPRRAAALELLALVGGQRAGELLLGYLEHSDEPWLRANAAWRLGELGLDWVIPRIILRFKYEKDFETVIWMAKSLGDLGNYTGLLALQAVADGTEDEVLIDSAYARMLSIAQSAGYDDVPSLWSAWTAGPAFPSVPEGLPTGRSRRYQLEVWKLIQRFTEYQLRGVDDSRFILQRLGTTATGIMGQALHDLSAYIRVGVAQSLQRMGPRAYAAGPALVRGLGDARLGPWAAVALGAIGAPAFEAGQAALINALSLDTDAETRLSAIRGLAGFRASPDARAISSLRTLLEAPTTNGKTAPLPEEFRQAACESLLALGETDGVFEPLLSWMTSSSVSPVSTQRALRQWLEGSKHIDEFARLIKAWDELSLVGQAVVSTEERARIKRTQASLLREALPELLAARSPVKNKPGETKPF